MGVSFFILAKSADFLVDGATAIAERLGVPKMIIGIVLVAFATTSPEFTVSVLAAIQGHPEIALGNAIGSVIADDAFALALGILVAPTVIIVDSRILKSAGIFLISIDVIAFLFSLNGTIGRVEGAFLIILLIGYLTAVVINEQKHRNRRKKEEIGQELKEHIKPGKTALQVLRFLAGVAGLLIGSELLINSSTNLAREFGVPESVIGLTMIALGTSLPEIATCYVASRKGHGDLALGDIIGADILNILWIVGAASLANPITVEKSVVFFAFPTMIVIVLTMLLFARIGYKLHKWKGVVLLSMYLLFLASSIYLFYFKGIEMVPLQTTGV